ncbi:MAG: hypothetical protein F6K23_15315 [Okeania sp. SIO2C9]|nr:hypothetical protein [Okeania sp. SIO2C9]NEQ74287.1 hypothetical protein [Okeania sp. SIO2C9]
MFGPPPLIGGGFVIAEGRRKKKEGRRKKEEGRILRCLKFYRGFHLGRPQ